MSAHKFSEMASGTSQNILVIVHWTVIHATE